MRQRLLRKLLALAVSILVALSVIEGGLRMLGLDSPLLWEPDPELGWKHIPGARQHWTEEGDGWVEINDLGLRDRPRQLDKPPGTIRVSVFGDSMTEAVQVRPEQTFAAHLEERLSREGRRVEVLNHGVAGYSPIQELLLFRREAPRFRPDLVVLAVFLDNDVADCHPDLRSSYVGVPFAAATGKALRFDFTRAEHSYAEYHAEPAYTARKYSAIYRFLGARLRGMSGSRGGGAPAGSEVPKRYQLYLKSPSPPWEEAWAVLEQALLEFAAEARQQQMAFAIVSVPAGQVVNADGWRYVLDDCAAMKSAEWDLGQPDRRLAEFARRHSLPLLQQCQEFQQAPQDPPLFFGHVGHFTPAGHELMARDLATFLTERHFLPDRERATVGAR